MTERRRRSRSSSRDRRERRRSPSRSGGDGRRGDSKRPRDEVEPVKSFYVPYRCLIPPESAGQLIGRGGSLLRQLVATTGAQVHVLRSEDNPRGLHDRIVIVNGSEKEKDDALQCVINTLRDYRRKDARDRETFVCLIPDGAGPMLIGTRGQNVHSISHRTGAEIDIAKECIRDTTDRPVTIKGTLKQTIMAMSLLNEGMQDYANRGRLVKRDFSFCDMFPPMGGSGPEKRSRRESLERETPRPQPQSFTIPVPKDFDSGIPAVISVTREEADWLVSSETIERVKKIESIHHCLVSIQEAPVPPLTSSHEVVEIVASRYAYKADGLEAVLRLLATHKADRVPGLLMPPSRTKVVIGASGATINKISAASGCFLKFDNRKGDINDERLNLLVCTGSIDAVVKAARLVVAKVDSSVHDDQQRDTPMRDAPKKDGPAGLGKHLGALRSFVEKQWSTSKTQTARLHFTSSELDRIEKVAAVLSEKSGECELSFDSSHLVMTGNRVQIALAVFHALGVDGVGDGFRGADSRDEMRDEDDVDYGEV